MARNLPYDPHKLEARWRARWDAEGTGLVDVATVAPGDPKKFYNLVEFPYPSAEGLHVGHVFKYSGADAFGRYQRMRGKKVFQPIGWDAFGIHTENFALSMDVHPMRLTGRTTEAYRAQLARGGMTWAWRHLVDTSRPNYYRWTQWLLVQFFRAGLLYQAEAPVLWCPSCLTVLAREQTENGGTTCERCGSVVGERVLRQWFLRMTLYADRLLDGLDALDWPERAKRLQRQWIGRSVGREIDFGTLAVFTTRPDTLPGVTFIAVPAGHPGAGTTVLHPLTGQALPVVEADYVVGDYGTGAVMGVPVHDERDARFAAAAGLAVSHAPLLSADEAARVGRPATRYRMRDWLISRQRYWGPPIPIIHCQRCGPVAVPEGQLPVVLPDVEEFRPTGTGRSPLAGVAEFVNTTCPDCGGPARRETDVSDTFVDSSWYFLRYPSNDCDDRPWDDELTARMLPVDFYAGGPEHVQRHHLYARFVTMALYDLGLVPFEEPFPRIRLGGMLVHQGAKMSKSRGNVVSPDPYWDEWGSDVVRCALLFSAPWQQGGDFTDHALEGIERFFGRLWRAVTEDAPARETGDARAIDRAIVRATTAVEDLRFNVAIAAAMELVNAIELGVGEQIDRARRTAVLLVAPLAPHLAEELWSRLGGAFSVHTQPWPEPDAAALAQSEVDLVVQVDGKVRDRLRVPVGLSEAQAREAAEASEKVTAALDGRRVVRAVHVPDRIMNLVTDRS